MIVFSFRVPEGVTEGTRLQVTAPDGVVLQIPLPSKARPGNRISMEKRAEDGKWGIKAIIREEVPGVSAPTGIKSTEQIASDLADQHTCHVELQTSKGVIKLTLVPSWAPKGCQRFLQLVTDKYYTDLILYRAVPGFLVQFGVVQESDPRRDKYEAIPDDAVCGVPIQEGMVCFAASGANTRKCTICIFLGDFEQLGKSPWETPIGKVAPESMAVLRKIFTGYGDMPQCEGTGPDPVELEEKGNAYILQKFPLLDSVKSAVWTA